MSRTYKATGINLKSMALGEADRLLTVLTREQGLVRAVAAGARKPKSKLGGRSSLFVVNTLLLAQGRSLDRISQAETVASYPGLGRNLAKLTVAQYWAELVLHQALSEQPQPELFDFLCDRLTDLEQAATPQVPVMLIEGIYQLLDWAGIAPQVEHCCITQVPLVPDVADPNWRVGFSPRSGGAMALSAWNQEQGAARASVPSSRFVVRDGYPPSSHQGRRFANGDRTPKPSFPKRRIREQTQLSAIELYLLQTLSRSLNGQELPPAQPHHTQDWLALERVLRHYIQYHFDRPIRSASLLDTCFAPIVTAAQSP